MRFWIGVLGLSVPWVASAEEPAADEFTYDRVLISTFQAEDEASQPDAVRLHDAIDARFRQNHQVVGMSEVPVFEVQGYGGEMYMIGCPPGQYPGCALVVGQRTDVDWVVGGTVRSEPDEFDPKLRVTLLQIHVVDVREAREVASFGMPVPPDREADAIEGIARVYLDVVKGEYELKDLRGDEKPEAASQLDEARREILAQSLSELEDQLGTAVKAAAVGRLEPAKVTREDLAAYADRDDVAPWERLGMSQPEYLRFANSGMSIDAWRLEGQGRFGRILLRAGGGFGSGPWHQSYTGQILLSDQTLQPVAAVQVLELVNEGSGSGDFELGFGVASFAEVALTVGMHTGQTRYLLDEDVQNQVAVPGKEIRYAMTSWAWGARVGLAPFPRWPARPTLGLGLVSWKGSGIPESDRFARLDAPKLTLLQVLPGAEVDASPVVGLFVRVAAELPIGGVTVRETRDGADLLPNAPVASDASGGGYTVQAGIQLRLGPLFRTGGGGPSSGMRFDDEEL